MLFLGRRKSDNGQLFFFLFLSMPLSLASTLSEQPLSTTSGGTVPALVGLITSHINVPLSLHATTQLTSVPFCVKHETKRPPHFG